MRRLQKTSWLCLETILYAAVRFTEFDVTIRTHFWQAFVSEFGRFLFLIYKNTIKMFLTYLLAFCFCFFSFSSFFFILITFGFNFGGCLKPWENQDINAMFLFKMTAILRSWRNSRVQWRHHLLKQLSKETSLGVITTFILALLLLTLWRRD